MSNSPLSTLVS